MITIIFKRLITEIEKTYTDEPFNMKWVYKYKAEDEEKYNKLFSTGTDGKNKHHPTIILAERELIHTERGDSYFTPIFREEKIYARVILDLINGTIEIVYPDFYFYSPNDITPTMIKHKEGKVFTAKSKSFNITPQTIKGDLNWGMPAQFRQYNFYLNNTDNDMVRIIKTHMFGPNSIQETENEYAVRMQNKLLSILKFQYLDNSDLNIDDWTNNM